MCTSHKAVTHSHSTLQVGETELVKIEIPCRRRRRSRFCCQMVKCNYGFCLIVNGAHIIIFGSADRKTCLFSFFCWKFHLSASFFFRFCLHTSVLLLYRFRTHTQRLRGDPFIIFISVLVCCRHISFGWPNNQPTIYSFIFRRRFSLALFRMQWLRVRYQLE